LESLELLLLSAGDCEVSRVEAFTVVLGRMLFAIVFGAVGAVFNCQYLTVGAYGSPN
jgi:hypothetical protein